jgi:hypothetical protein
MRVQIERTYLTTEIGTRVIGPRSDRTIVESDSLARAMMEFIFSDGAKLLGTITESEGRAVATAWKDRVYRLTAEPAPD